MEREWEERANSGRWVKMSEENGWSGSARRIRSHVMHVYHGLGGSSCTLTSHKGDSWTDPASAELAVDFCVFASSAYTTDARVNVYHLYVVFGSQEEALPGNAP